MSRVRFHFLAVFAALSACCSAVPMTVKELDFLVRVGTPEAEILRDLDARRLIAPLDPAGESQLKANGASAALVDKIKSGVFTLPPEQARAAALRESANRQLVAGKIAEAEKEVQAQVQRNAQVAARYGQRGVVQNWLQDQLVYQEGGNLKPLDPGKVVGTRVFAFYVASISNGPCKKFTPKLVSAYRELKEKYPELEVVFVSNDRDEYNMTEFMRSFGMPWPALKYQQMPPQLTGFFGDYVPWLVLVGDDGRPLSQNGVDKRHLDPDQMLASLDGFLAQRRTLGL